MFAAWSDNSVLLLQIHSWFPTSGQFGAFESVLEIDDSDERDCFIREISDPAGAVVTHARAQHYKAGGTRLCSNVGREKRAETKKKKAADERRRRHTVLWADSSSSDAPKALPLQLSFTGLEEQDFCLLPRLRSVGSYSDWMTTPRRCGDDGNDMMAENCDLSDFKAGIVFEPGEGEIHSFLHPIPVSY